VPEIVQMIKCPGCALELPEEDFEGQRRHLLANHPDIISQRLMEHKRWDGWEQD
jgi:hypothetical protein